MVVGFSRVGRFRGFRDHRLHFVLGVAWLYGALWPLMNVEFIAHRFPAPFRTGATFFHWYSRIAGGPVQYASYLLCQTYSRHWAGVLGFTLLALAAWAVARGILRRFSAGSCNWPAAAFPIIILILAASCAPLWYILPMLAGLAAAWLYTALSQKRLTAILFLIASVPLYYLLASGFLYLCAVCALFELLVRKRPLWGLAWIALGAATPYGMSLASYEPEIAARYLRWMRKPQFDIVSNGLLVAMYLFVPAGAAIAFLMRRVRLSGRFAPLFRRTAQVAALAVLAVLAWRLIAVRLDTSGLLYADYLLDAGRPDEALASLAQTRDDGDPARFLTFYALARAGRLPWEMFHYPQVQSSDALLFRDTVWDTIPGISEWRSDLYLELGRVNESQRWAHEALTVDGETPRVLERMALVYVLDGNPDAAKTFVHALATIPFQAERAQELSTEIDRDPGMRGDPLVARIRPLMLHQDYIGTWNTEQILQQCLEANPSNRMAFEYLMAHYLLTSDLDGFARMAPRLKDFYRDLPTLFQEALLGYRNVNDSLPPGVEAWAISPQTQARFQSFVDAWLRYQNSPPEQAWEALAPSFGDTYWFFYIFGRTAAGPPPQFGAHASTKAPTR